MRYQSDSRVVMTLDAGGTNFVFGAIRGNEDVVEPVRLPAAGGNLEQSIANLIAGFAGVEDQLEERAVAISFAFPGPADYEHGIIGDLVNLPGYRGGVPLGPILEDRFGLPVFINNDGDLFTYGEAIAGFLLWVNGLLKDAGSTRRYRNLLGVTLGTGFGGGIVTDGRLHLGDNSAAAEIWALRNRIEPTSSAEESVSIRGVQRSYVIEVGIPLEEAPMPEELFRIGIGEKEGEAGAARKAFTDMGRALGDALANAITLVDAPIVVGGGLAGAHPLFMPAVIEEMNTGFTLPGECTTSRMEIRAFNLENDGECHHFCNAEVKELTVPGTDRHVSYDPLKRTGIGLSKLGTSRAISIGAYAFALSELDHR